MFVIHIARDDLTLIKTSLLNAIAVAVRILTLLGINKILAVYVGPSGYAALGQFQNAVQMITTLASGAINTGVTKYTAEYYADEDKQRTVWRTAGTIALIGSFILSMLVFVFRNYLTQWFLGDLKYSNVFVWFSATLILFVFNTLLLAILNGKKDIPRYVVANIAGSIFALLITAWMVINWGLFGALVALAIYQSLAFFVTLALCFKTSWFRFSYLFGQLDKEVAKNLAKYTAMALTSAITVPLSHIMIRNHLGQTLGWEVAGYWEAIWRLSGAYLMFVTTTLGVYYLPRLSEIKNSHELKKEILNGYKIILPIAAISSLLIYLLRDFIIHLLFTKEFLPMRDMFAWQMIGDTLKIGSWILAYLMLGQAMVKIFLLTEVVFCISFYLWTWLLTDSLGYQAPVIAHALNYALYWSSMCYFVLNKIDNKSVF